MKKITMLVLCLAAAALWGQTPTGSVSGTVTDTTGAAVANATVRIINSATQETHTASSNASGAYMFPIVPAGSYTLEAESSGFKTEQRQGVKLDVNQNARADFVLQVGSVQRSGRGEERSPDGGHHGRADSARPWTRTASRICR